MTYGTTHQPLTATVQPNRRNPGQVVAFMGAQLCFFERGTPTPKAGATVEVMIVRPLHPRDGDGNVDFDRLTALEIRVVDHATNMLVATDGFERYGSQCSTTAFGCPTDGSRALERPDGYRGRIVRRESDKLRDTFTLTPGRSGIRFADNVNARPGDPRSLAQIVPTNVWVERDPRTGRALRRSRVPGDSPTVRVAGLTRIEDLECAALVRTATETRRAA
jgi:hypothetical protein